MQWPLSITIDETSVRTTSETSIYETIFVAENTIVDLPSLCQTSPVNDSGPRCEPPSGAGSPGQATDASYEPMFEGELRVESSGTTEQIDGEPGLPTTMDLVRDVFSKQIERGDLLDQMRESAFSHGSDSLSEEAQRTKEMLQGFLNVQIAAHDKSLNGALIQGTVRCCETFWKTLMKSQ